MKDLNFYKDLLSQFGKIIDKGNNSFNACCPCHNDKNPSLTVTEKPELILFHCHAGCNYNDIVNKLNLKYEDYSNKKISKNFNKKIEEVIKTLDEIKNFDISNIYIYENEKGIPAHLTTKKYTPNGKKTFSQWGHIGNNKFKNNLNGIKTYLYKLPELIKGIAENKTIFIVEGEKDVETLNKYGLIATTNPMGASKWRESYNCYFKNANVIILPDNDPINDTKKIGYDHALQVANNLIDITPNVKIVQLPRLEEKEDITDWLNIKGGTIEELKQLINKTDCHEKKLLLNGFEVEPGKKIPQATKIYNAIIPYIKDLFVDNNDNEYIIIDEKGINKTYLIDTTAFRKFIINKSFNAINEIARGDNLTNICNSLKATATGTGKKLKVYKRIAQDNNGNLYFNLSNEAGEVVKITPNGWEIINNAPVLFINGMGSLPLPRPQKGGNINNFKKYINVKDDEFILITAFLIGALNPEGSYPILCINGEQGTGKSYLTRFIKELIDPNEAPLKIAPKKEEDLYITCQNNWLVAVDNLSHIAWDISDLLCVFSTGGSISKRSLYSNGEEHTIKIKNPLIINGITEVIDRPDLQDRTIFINLELIKSHIPENQIKEEFNKNKPLLIGALMDCLVNILKNTGKSNIQEILKNANCEKIRMADFTEWVYNASPLINGDMFIRTYYKNRLNASELQLQNEPMAQALLKLLEEKEIIEDTAENILKELKRIEEAENLPKDGKGLSRKLIRIAPNFRNAYNLEISFNRSSKNRIIKIRTKTKLEENNMNITQENLISNYRDF